MLELYGRAKKQIPVFCNIGILRDRRVMESKVFKTFLWPRCSVSLFVFLLFLLVCFCFLSSFILQKVIGRVPATHQKCQIFGKNFPNLWQKLSNLWQKKCQSRILLLPKIYVLANKLKLLDWLQLVGWRKNKTKEKYPFKFILTLCLATFDWCNKHIGVQ